MLSAAGIRTKCAHQQMAVPAAVSSMSWCAHTRLTVTPAGVPLKAWFCDIEGDDQDEKVLKAKDSRIPCGMFERSDGALHILRVRGVRWAVAQ